MVFVPVQGDGTRSLVFINNHPSNKKFISCQYMSHVSHTKKNIIYFNTKKGGKNHKIKARGPNVLLGDEEEDFLKKRIHGKEEKKTKLFLRCNSL